MVTLSYEMGYTIPEFKKTLYGQFIGEENSYKSTEITSSQWQVSVADELDVIIDVSEAPPRVIAMLSLPILHVVFRFTSSNKKLQDEFLKRFFKYFHKGGG